MKISCEVNGHKYVTEKLYFKDFLTIGFLIEEKIGPFIACFTACIGNNLSDSELLKALYSSCKDILNREDMSFICDLVINREHLTIDGKKLDNADWEKFWQEVGFFDYQAKYITQGGCETRVPADLPGQTQNDIRRFSEIIFKALRGSGLARADFLVGQDGAVWF